MHAPKSASPPAPRDGALPKHFVAIDALRGVAALAVLIFHYHHFYLADATGRPGLPSEATFPYAAAFEWVFRYGKYAVEVFWVISGFVFAHVYLSRPTNARQFLVARFARLYPLHFVTLLLVAGMQLLSINALGHYEIYEINDLRHFGLQLAFLSSSTKYAHGLSFNGPIWSVSVEMASYVIFFFALPLVRRSPAGVSIVLAFSCWTLGVGQVWLPVVNASVFLTASYFFFGCVLYALVRHLDNRAVPVVGLAALLGVAGKVQLEYAPDTGMQFIAGAFVLLASAAERLPVVRLRSMRTLGDMSYSIYLVHVPIQMAILLIADLAFDGTRAFADSYVVLPVFMVVSIWVSHSVFYRFERPVNQWLRQKLSVGACPKPRASEAVAGSESEPR